MKKGIWISLLIIIFTLVACNMQSMATSKPSSSSASAKVARVIESPYLDMETIFPDDEFREEVIEQLQRFNEGSDFTQEDLSNITSLDCNTDNVVGIRMLRNLEKLIIRKDIIFGQNELALLKTLSEITIYDITSLEPFRGLDNIEVLDFYTSQISDISVLATLSNLKQFNTGIGWYLNIKNPEVLETTSIELTL